MCIVALFCAGFVLVLSDAFASRQVVVEPFEAPPALAARGLSGKVVAEGLLDKLTQLQAATRSTAQNGATSQAPGPARSASRLLGDRGVRRRDSRSAEIPPWP